MRVIVLSTRTPIRKAKEDPRLDAQIRVGGDAGRQRGHRAARLRRHGARRGGARHRPAAARRARRRLVAGPRPRRAAHLAARPDRSATDHGCRRGRRTRVQALKHLGEHYAPGDTDFAWTRLTLWRAQLAAVLDQPPFEPITAVEVGGVVRLAVDRTARGVVAARASGQGDHGDHAAPCTARAASTGCDWSAHRASSSSSAITPAVATLVAAGPADARHLAAPPQPARLPGRGTAQARPRRPVRRGGAARGPAARRSARRAGRSRAVGKGRDHEQRTAGARPPGQADPGGTASRRGSSRRSSTCSTTSARRTSA